MNKTKIEWVKNPDGTQGYTWNPITGCLNQTDGLCNGGGFPCYAYRLANGRLKRVYLMNPTLAGYDADKLTGRQKIDILEDPFYPRFWEERFDSIGDMIAKPRGVFVCDMSDLFGIGIPKGWTNRVLEHIRWCSQHRFYLLTKQPQNLQKWSPFPDNCWVGVTATNDLAYTFATHGLEKIQAKVKYISFEPLLQGIDCNKQWDKRLTLSGINWLIIGAQTKPYKPPKIGWVKEIVKTADRAGIPVFLKDNLEPLWTLENRCEPFFKFSRPSPSATEIGQLRQEMPVEIEEVENE